MTWPRAPGNTGRLAARHGYRHLTTPRPEGRELTITTSTADMDETDTGPFMIPAGRYAVLAVMDTGTGLDAPTQARETPCSARCLK